MSCLASMPCGRLEEENRVLKEELKRRMDDLEALTAALTSERDELVRLLIDALCRYICFTATQQPAPGAHGYSFDATHYAVSNAFRSSDKRMSYKHTHKCVCVCACAHTRVQLALKTRLNAASDTDRLKAENTDLQRINLRLRQEVGTSLSLAGSFLLLIHLSLFHE